MKFSTLLPFSILCTLPSMAFAFLLKGDALGPDCERPTMTAHYLLNEMDLYSQRGFSLLADIRPADLVALSSEPEAFPKIGQALKNLFHDLRTDRSKFATALGITTDHEANIYTVEVVDHAIQSAFRSTQACKGENEAVIRPELLRLFFECLYENQLGMMGNFQLLYIFVHFGAGPFTLQDVASFTWPSREMSIITQSFAYPYAAQRYFGLNSPFELSALLWSNVKTQEAKSLLFQALGNVISQCATTTMAEIKLILSRRPCAYEPLANAPFSLMQAFYRPDSFLTHNSGTPVEAQVENGNLTITSRSSTTSSLTTVSGPMLFSKAVEQITLDDIAELERLGFDTRRYSDVMKPIMEKLNHDECA